MSEQAPGEERARRLEAAVEPVIRRVEALDEEWLYREPGPDDWSVMEVLAHLAELLPYWARQARDVATRERGDEPFGRTHEDPDRIAAVEGHARDPLEAVLPRIRAGLAEATSTLRALPPDRWARTARHARRGQMTVEQIVDQFLVAHAEEHAEQIEVIIRRHNRP